MTTSTSSESLRPLELVADETQLRGRCDRDDSGAEAVAIASRYFDRSKYVNARTDSSRMTTDVFRAPD